MTLKKSKIPEKDAIVVEYGSSFEFGSSCVELEEIEDESPSFEEKTIEVTGYNTNGEKFRIYLDKNKIELVQDRNGDFQGCIGSVLDIYEPLDA